MLCDTDLGKISVNPIHLLCIQFFVSLNNSVNDSALLRPIRFALLFVLSILSHTFRLSFFGRIFRQKCLKIKRFQGDLIFFKIFQN